MRVKICGITKVEQGKAIASLGATALGFICLEKSPRYVKPASIKRIVEELPPTIDKIGVFVNADREKISRVVAEANLTGIQLHGEESPQLCQQLRQQLAGIEIIKALRIKTRESLSAANAYSDCVDALLLDAYHPQLRGGTGQTIDWDFLATFNPSLPWLLAGGMTPENIITAVSQVRPNGIDVSSGVERSPGDKDLDKVAQLLAKIKDYGYRLQARHAG